jgi:hypothetical protein
MIDYDLLIIAVFSLLFFVIIGGTILLFPLSRKLGHLIEARTKNPREGHGLDDATARRLVSRLDALEEQIGALAERQEFLDGLLMEKRPASSLGRGKEV